MSLVHATCPASAMRRSIVLLWLRHFMLRHRRASWIASAVLITAFVAVLANVLTLAPQLQSTTLEVVLAEETSAVQDTTPDTAVEVGLTLHFPEQSEHIQYSSEAEVLRFTLKAEGPYSLRYLTLSIQTEGLQALERMSVYEWDGKELGRQVGQLEGQVEDWHRFRFFDPGNSASAYLGAADQQEFVVMGRVLRDSSAQTQSSLTIRAETNVPPEWGWAWLPGTHTEAWIYVLEHLDGNSVALPKKTWQKR